MEASEHAARLPLTGLCAALACCSGVLVLFGWAADFEPLKRVLPGLVAMNPLTAMLFVLAGTALWLEASGWQGGVETSRARRQLARLLVAVLMLATVARIADGLWGFEAGVDQWLFATKLAADSVAPNRMAPNTALNFLLLGAALLLLDVTTRRGHRPSEYLAVALGLGALLGLIGYLYRIPILYGVRGFIPMALHTAALFLVLALGILAARPNQGWMAVAMAPGVAGTMARRLYPALVLAVVVMGFLRLEGERRGMYGAALGVALYTVAFISLVTVLIGWNVLKLHRAEAARRQVEEERERFFALTPDMLCIVGFDGRFRSLNPAWEDSLGYTREELMARPLLALVHPDDRAATVKTMARLAGGRVVESFENRCCRKDGDYRWMAWNAIPAISEGLVYATARDVTGRKHAETAIRVLNSELAANAAQLQQSNRELEAFSYSISHDLRAPLRHIGGYAQILQEDAGDQLDAEMRRYLDAIGGSARQMGTLIDDLLAFSRLGRKQVERSDVNMRELVEHVVRALNTDGQALVSVGPLPDAKADPVLLKQVWVNLVSNALKYSAPRGDAARIEISGKRLDGVTSYRISDNGVGFDMRYADKLFGVFQRLHSQEEFEGTGVGLAIVERIVLRHGGTISAQSEPGLGATFTFELPAELRIPPDVPSRELPV